jgi:hypothetical protein
MYQMGFELLYHDFFKITIVFVKTEAGDRKVGGLGSLVGRTKKKTGCR